MVIVKRLAALSIILLLLLAPLASGQKQGIATSQSPHGNLNIPCQNCHTAQGWKPIRAVPEFDHNQTSYPLRGMHVGVACTACHVKQVFSNVGSKCQDCHADIHKRTLGANCEQCHTVRGWNVSIQQIQDHNNRFPLTGAHAAVDCVACHKNAGNSKFQTMPTNCLSCHMKEFKATTNPSHTAGGAAFQAPCESCHSTDNWQNAKFDHSATGFPLTGGHSVPPRACVDCHTNNNYNLPASSCASCHIKLFQNSTNPNHVAGGFPQTCESCHTTAAWSPATFDHSLVGFALAGAHADPPRACADCHVNNNYNLTTKVCISCHQKDFDGATTPLPHSGFPTTCESCHDTVSWTNGKFDHATTGFTLTGGHTVPPRACSDCHINNNYNITVTTCVSCHQTDFNNAKNPDHVQGGFSTTCQTCHNTSAWQPATFDHSKTSFPLTGAHMDPPRVCADCHINNNYNITVTTCISCHQTDFNNATSPVAHAGFPTTCQSCHDTVSWTDANFDHSTTGFPLTGLHTVPPRACADCHINNNYNLTSTACVTCHLKDFNGAKNPDHVAGGFAQTCDICHTTSAWSPATFDHSKSGFPLVGAHTVPPRACADCHVNNNYQITVTTCVSCHQSDYNGATTPVPHTGFPTTCESCHDTVLWTNGKFDHSATGFVLTGAHTDPPRVCTDCHINNNYNITVTTCVSCHQTDYNNAKTPVPHTGFPLTCQSCHDTVQWTDGKFDHSATGWPLVGAHMDPPRVCTDCHINNNYNITVTTCVSCHQTDYNNAKSPVSHVGFPTTCEQCHDTVLWTDAKFDHSTTGFPLVGAHTVPPRACADCHINNNYNITVTTCISCHQTDYNNAKSPVSHVGFPTTCQQCHDTVLWTNAKFDHSATGFPLVGAHTVPPRACIDCHVNNNYNITTATCISCHQTDYNNAKTPVPHTGFPTTCENCHDTVLWTNGKFDHTTTGFPLVGAHTVPPRACTDCHVNNNYSITVTTCISCHQAAFNGATSPVPHTGFPTTCELCHDTILWTDATFNHNNTPFPLTGQHVVPPRACADCHVNNNYTTLPLTCIGCHQTLYNNTTNPGHAAQPTFFPSAQCSTCHTTSGWTPATFNHSQYTRFSINHGNANGVCATCHTNSNDYSIFQCTQCHGGNNSANFNHPQVNGYVYNSVNCYQCHSGG